VKRTGWRNERGLRGSRKHTRLLQALLLVLALGAGGATGALRGEALLARAFPARAAQVRLAVTGNVHATPEALAAAAGIGPGTRLAALDLARVRAGVAAEPWVREAHVAALPPDLLLVSVQEREPVAVAQLGAETWLVDRSGWAFAPAPEGTVLPRLVGATARDDARLADGVAWLAALAAHQLTAPPQLVLADPDPERVPALELGADAAAPGARVLLGAGERDAKLARLARLLTAQLPELANAAEIDLRFGSDVVLRPRPPAEVADSSSISNGG